MKREQIKMSNIENISSYLDDAEGVEGVEENTIYVDVSKGYYDLEAIFKRESDGKFF